MQNWCDETIGEAYHITVVGLAGTCQAARRSEPETRAGMQNRSVFEHLVLWSDVAIGRPNRFMLLLRKQCVS